MLQHTMKPTCFFEMSKLHKAPKCQLGSWGRARDVRGSPQRRRPEFATCGHATAPAGKQLIIQRLHIKVTGEFAETVPCAEAPCSTLDWMSTMGTRGDQAFPRT